LLASLAPGPAGYVISGAHSADALGLTTELAPVAACLLGAMTTLGYRGLAVGLGVAVAAVLAYKAAAARHGAAARPRGRVRGLRLLIATFIVLPLLPDQPIDPWGALRPRSLWMLVLLISSLSLVGYVATRLLGANRGIPLTGPDGRPRVLDRGDTGPCPAEPRPGVMPPPRRPWTSGILLAWAVMFARIVVEVAVVNASLLGELLPPFVAMAVVAAAWQRTFAATGPATIALPACR